MWLCTYLMRYYWVQCLFAPPGPLICCSSPPPCGSVISGTRAASAIGHEPVGTHGGRGGAGSGTPELLVGEDYLLVFELHSLALTSLNWSTEQKQSHAWLILSFISERQVYGRCKDKNVTPTLLGSKPGPPFGFASAWVALNIQPCSFWPGNTTALVLAW